MGSKVKKLLGVLLFLVLVNAGLFSLATIRLTSFWVSWSFIHVAVLIFSAIHIFSVSAQEKLMFAFSESALATYYLIVETVAGFVLMLNFALVPFAAFVAQAVLLLAFVCAYFILKRVNGKIGEREQARNADLKNFRYVLEVMQDVQNQVSYTAPYKKVVEHAYDAISGSPMRSIPEVYGIEQSIVDLIVQLKQEVMAENEEVINNICKDIENKAAERNSRIQLSR